MPDLRTDAITRPQDLESLEEEWRELFARCPAASPFQSPAWLLAWLRAFEPGELLTIAVRRRGELVGLAPFFVHAEGRTRQLTFIGNGVSDHLDLLCHDDDAGLAARAVVSRLQAERPRWTHWDLRDLPARSALAALQPQGCETSLAPEEPCPLVRLPDRADAVLALLAKRSRSDLLRRGRRMAEAGEIGFETAEDEPSRRAFLESLIRLHEARWRTRGDAGVFADPKVAAFHQLAGPDLMREGLLRLHALRLDGEIIAAWYVLRRGAWAGGYVQAFDPAHAEFAPGLQLLVHAMQEAVREGARVFDLLRGREAYKYAWGAEDQAKVRRRARALAQASLGSREGDGDSPLASRP